MKSAQKSLEVFCDSESIDLQVFFKVDDDLRVVAALAVDKTVAKLNMPSAFHSSMITKLAIEIYVQDFLGVELALCEDAED